MKTTDRARRLVSRGPEETRSLAARLARKLRGGEVLCLFGPLGSGKTTFIQGLARALGCRAPATSPSFLLVREYRPRTRRKNAPGAVYHMDFYRIASGEIANLGLEDYLGDPRGVCLIEWAESALGLLPEDRLELSFAHSSSRRKNAPRTERSLSLRARGASAKRLLEKI